MLLKSNEVYQRYTALRNRKSARIALDDQIDEFFSPDDAILTGKKSVGMTGSPLLKGELLETTGTDLIDEYVAFVLGIQYITENRWFSIRSFKYDVTDDINRVLNARADTLYALIARSNYYSCMPELERDTVLHGVGALRIEEDEEHFVRCHTAEPRNLVLSQDVYGKVDFMCWPESYTVWELQERFPSIMLDRQFTSKLQADYKDRHFIALTACYKNKHKKKDEKEWIVSYAAYPLADRAELVNREEYVLNIDEHEEYDMCPVYPVRDMMKRGTAYGQGIGRKALPKARIANKLMYNLLKLSGLQGNPPRVQHPMITAEVGNNGELQEGQVLSATKYNFDEVRMNELVQLLQVTGDLNGMLQLYQLQQSMFSSLLPTAGSIYKVARQSISEIQQRLEEQEKRLAPLRSNFLREGPACHLKYFYKLAQKKGYFNKEHLRLPQNVRLTELEFSIDAFLLSAFKQGKALRAAQSLGILANFLSLDPSGVDNFNIDKIVEIGCDGFNVLDILDSRENVRQKRQIQQQQLQQQQMMQQQQMQASTDASNAKMMELVAGLGQGG